MSRPWPVGSIWLNRQGQPLNGCNGIEPHERAGWRSSPAPRVLVRYDLHFGLLAQVALVRSVWASSTDNQLVDPALAAHAKLDRHAHEELARLRVLERPSDHEDVSMPPRSITDIAETDVQV